MGKGERVNIVGIDYSSFNVDIVMVHMDDAHSPLWFRYPLEGADAFERTRNVAQALPGAHSTNWDDVLAVGIENPGARHPGVNVLWRVQGTILACLPPRMRVEPLPPAKWRTLCGLKGNATKTDVLIASTTALHAHNAWPQDAHDAHLIALATRTLIHQEQAA